MFDKVLLKAELEVGTLSEQGYKEFLENKSQEDLYKIAISLLDEMESPIEYLLSMVKNLFSKNIFNSSKIERLCSNKLSPTLSEIRIRPKNDYYKSLRKALPSPDNPDGTHATGLEISFSILKGFSFPDKTIFPRLHIEFTIWGAEERKAFGKLLKNYYRTIELLLSQLEVEFFASCCSDRLKYLKTNNSFKCLATYFEEDDDQENTFTIERIFTYGESYNDIIKIFLVFVALYDSCLGYLSKKKSYDKILDYHYKLKTV